MGGREGKMRGCMWGNGTEWNDVKWYEMAGSDLGR